MSFFDDVKKFGRNLTDKGKDIVEITKLNSQINSEKENIKELYRKIGEQVYEDYKNSGESTYGELCGQIAEIEAKIKELSDKVLELKNASKCPSCGTEVNKQNAFCPKCGTKIAQE
ncbi:MAG: zinc-ribbon domain-containing protein [Clostridiaceae bacterium]|jgi:rubrerythrin|nr:zinc-ribbon domain-containing protein [Clostridiaceae bacterium]